jgi:putative membrane protein
MHSLSAADWPAIGAEPTVAIGLLVAAGAYGLGVARLWRSAGPGRGITRGQIVLYAFAMLTLALALLSPVDTLSDDLFSAHMVQHLLLICVAAPLLVLGSPLVALLWALPRQWRGTVGQWWGSRPRARMALSALGLPAVAWCLHAVAVAFWHIPKPYGWALAHASVHAIEHVSFLVTACLFWWVVLPGRSGRHLGSGAGVLYVAAMAIVMGIYGAVVTFAPTPWYSHYAERTAAWGLTSLADQQLAGLVMWIPASVVYLGAALWCVADWLRVEERRHTVDPTQSATGSS